MASRSSDTRLPLPSESMMPRPRRADDGRLRTQRRQANFRALGGYLCAVAADFFPDPVNKERRTLHHAAAQHNRFRTKNVDQVCQSEAEIVTLAFHRIARQFVARGRHCADLFRTQAAAGTLLVHPPGQGWTGRERLPAAERAAVAWRPAGVDNLVANLRMRAVHPAIEFAL